MGLFSPHSPQGRPGYKHERQKPQGLPGAAPASPASRSPPWSAASRGLPTSSPRAVGGGGGELGSARAITTAGSLALSAVGPGLVPRPRTSPSSLPTSVQDGHSGGPKSDSVAATYHWRPVQTRAHEQRNDMAYSVGTYVSTLSMHVAKSTFEGATAHLVRLEATSFVAKEALWCYLVGGHFVMCRGVVVGVCPREHDPESGRNMRIARLPSHMRPRTPLQFAALSREAFDVGGHIAYSTHLVTLIVTPDGWITGVSSREAEGAIDLSAIRYSIGGGISLVDQVTLHTVDVGGTRMATLQGTLNDRFFSAHSQKPFALLPESCRPPQELAFVSTGTSPGGYHLLIARPSRGGGMGGDLIWRDSIWNHDQIHLTGVMFEVADDALPHSTLDSSWNAESLKVFVLDFQNFLVRKFGSIEDAWHNAFDTDGSGSVNFTEFGLGCKASGYVGNATRLWAALDEDRSGEISLEELKMDVGVAKSGQAPAERDPRKSVAACLVDMVASEAEAQHFWLRY